MFFSPSPVVTPIPESSPLIEKQDTISTMCQQLSQGLSFLSNHSGDPFDPEMSKTQKAEGIFILYEKFF